MKIIDKWSEMVDFYFNKSESLEGKKNKSLKSFLSKNLFP